MTAEQIKKSIDQGERVYGTLLTGFSPMLPLHFKKMGLDFIFIDTEHIPLHSETLATMCRGFSGLDIAPIVRIPCPDPNKAAQALDFGAKGVVAPYIETAEEVQHLRGAVKYRPLKGRRLEEFLFNDKPLGPELRTYLDQYNQDCLLLVNIESVPAMENLGDILDVPDLDGILIGPHDLSCSLGYPHQYESEVFTKAISQIIRSVRKRNQIAGLHFSMCGQLSLASHWLNLGVNLYIHQADIVFTTVGLADELAELQGSLQENVRFFSERISI
jgi:4-hydroxy-2-oxoheptanedioate aldolase